MRETTNYIIVHCAATRPSMDIGVTEIRKWHKARGWRDVGYHFVIRRDGTVEPGRPLMSTGAHAKGFNSSSVGICLVGGIDVTGDPDANFTRAQYESLERTIRGVIFKLQAVQGADVPMAIIGHRDLPGVTKACPCFNVAAWWANR